MGGMAAQIPRRKDRRGGSAAIEAVRDDKQREAGDGFDGTWVAHPDTRRRGDGGVRRGAGRARPTRSSAGATTSRRRRPSCSTSPPRRATITEDGLRLNVNIGIQYISSWLRGNGAAAIYGLMEDAATAEISRSQVWQWLHHGVELADDRREGDAELVRRLETEELEKIRAEIGDDEWFEKQGRPKLSREIFEEVALADDYADFLTLPAYERLED